MMGKYFLLIFRVRWFKSNDSIQLLRYFPQYTLQEMMLAMTQTRQKKNGPRRFMTRT